MFYDNLIGLCMNAEVTPTKLARDIGIRQSTVSMWKQQGTTPKYETLKKIADYFDVPISELLYGDTAGTISTAIDIAMDATSRKSNKPEGYLNHGNQGEEDMMSTALEAVKDVDPYIYNLLVEYQDLSDEQKKLLVATAHQFNLQNNRGRKTPTKTE